MRSIVAAILGALLLSGGTAASFGCSDCSVRGQDPIEYTAGRTNQSRTVYESVTVDGEMLHFPQGRTYDFVHGLGAKPVSVDIYLSFAKRLCDEDSTEPDCKDGTTEDAISPNNVAPSAGNQAVIEAWTPEFIRVRNDTCAEFHIRIVAMADPDEVAAASLSGAAGAAGAPSN